MHHAHFCIEIVDHRDEDGFGRSGHCGGAPFLFTLVAEDNMFETLGQVRIEFRFQRGLACGAEAKHDVTLQGADAAYLGGEIAFVFLEFTDVVQDDPGNGEIAIDLRVER